MSIEVATRLQYIRKKHGLSQRELAKRAGVTNGTISLIEQNRVSPSVGSLKKLLESIPMSLAEFFTFEVEASRGVVSRRVGVDCATTVPVIAQAAASDRRSVRDERRRMCMRSLGRERRTIAGGRASR